MNSTLRPGPDTAEIAGLVRTWASANPELARLLASGPAVGPALMHWGVHLANNGRFAEAAAAFRTTVVLLPRNSDAWTNYGVALDRAEGAEGAAECFERSIALKHDQPDVWLLLGLARRRMGRLEEAVEAFRTAVELDPKSAVGWQCYALVREQRREELEAIECLKRCLECGGGSAAVYGNLGRLCHQNGRIEEAQAALEEAVRLEGANEHFREMLRRARFLRSVLRGEPMEGTVEAYRTAFPEAAPCTDADLKAEFETAFGLLSGYGHLEAAERVGRRHLELWPESPSMDYLLHAIRADPSIERSPPGYVASHFDAFAASFDARLVDRLGYNVPGQLRAAIEPFVGPDAGGGRLDVFDAGCGTGLCGPLLRPLARSLTGVDLSPRMIEKARARGVYDRLECGDLVAFLEGTPGAFDLAVAADVIIYFGNLAPLLAAAARALRSGGILAFSIETLEAGDGYRLRPSGRFAHGRSYVRGLAREAFTELAWVETTLRQDTDRRLPGELFVLRRR